MNLVPLPRRTVLTSSRPDRVSIANGSAAAVLQEIRSVTMERMRRAADDSSALAQGLSVPVRRGPRNAKRACTARPSRAHCRRPIGRGFGLGGLCGGFLGRGRSAAGSEIILWNLGRCGREYRYVRRIRWGFGSGFWSRKKLYTTTSRSLV